MELLGDLGHEESRFFPFGDSVSLGVRLLHVWARRTICSEIILEAPDRTLGDEAQVKARSIWS